MNGTKKDLANEQMNNNVQNHVEITDAEKLAAENYQRKLQIVTEQVTQACLVELNEVLEKYNRVLAINYVQQNPMQPSVGQIIVIPKQ